MYKKIEFTFSTKDPEFKTFVVNVENPVSNNLIQHAFVSTPIYDKYNKKIGYKVSDDYIQQVSVDKYLIRIQNTYYIEGCGTISWNYSFLNTTSSYYYPLGTTAKSNIISTTGKFLGKTGFVSLKPYEDGTRKVKIYFDN